MLKTGGTEYALTRDDPNAEAAFCVRFDAMLIAPAKKGLVLDSVSFDSLKANFIILSASLIPEGDPGIDGMVFCVSFCQRNAEPLQQDWVLGSVMIRMAAHSLMKKKHIYDETLIHKVGWTARVNVTMKSDTVTYYDSSDEDNVLLNKLAI